jgi:hypothetical protein
MNQEMVQCIELNNSDIQLIHLQSSSIQRQKFVDLRARPQTTEKEFLVGTTLKIA